MSKDVHFSVAASAFHDEMLFNQLLRANLGIGPNQHLQFDIIKKSLDARGKVIKYNLLLKVYVDESREPPISYFFEKKDISKAKEVHIIGAGPAGLFCALQCIEQGLKPVIFERGKNVKERRRDLAILNKEGVLNEESNYCFGEGGAGTYSDGKLYTRSNKRGKLRKVLEWFCFFGAEQNILFEAHPHIGTNKLPNIIENIRNTIIECGGEVHFNAKLTDLEILDAQVRSITINQHSKIKIQKLILATGHSASDVYHLLQRKNILLESKSFALGVRVEHPQAIIDSLQYHCTRRPDYLPPSSYSVVEQVNGRGVFSFCMCPGGIIAPASTLQNSLVVNGWSPSKRNNPYANSGIVVSIEQKDFLNSNPLSGIQFQHEVEQKAFSAGGGKFVAPAMRMTDFIHKRLSSDLPQCSYLPGVRSALLDEVLPDFVYESLQKAFILFGKKMKGYCTEEAIVLATESRTSSPVRIPRDIENLHHVQIMNLYPCAEGAGYAGGIVSAAMDGINVAIKLQM